jgi:uncharacterized protein YuzB (UPF0349 family)
MKRFKRFLQRWLEIDKLEEECLEYTNLCKKDVVDLINKRTTMPDGGYVNHLLEKVWKNTYAIRNYLDLDIVDKKEKTWTDEGEFEETTHFTFIPTAVKRKKPKVKGK